ncbi:hypothetical protein [Streptomyces nigra]|uniref:hypothetical protein n=1 Tax=Streptomyces nigra TaxID=1827580 RepID=UPI0013DE096F
MVRDAETRGDALLGGESFVQECGGSVGVVEEEPEPADCGQAHVRVVIAGEFGELRATLTQEGDGLRATHRGVVLGLGTVLLEAAVQGLPADAHHQLDDSGPVRGGVVCGQFEKEGQTGRRWGIHAALVVDRAVEPVEGRAAFLGVRGTQGPQQPRHLLGRAVCVLHRRPVDGVKSVEHDPNHARRH